MTVSTHIKEKLQALYNEVEERIQSICDVFIEFFGEENVELRLFPSYEKYEKSYDNHSIAELLGYDIPPGVTEEEWKDIGDLCFSDASEEIQDLITNSEHIFETLPTPNIYIRFPFVRVTNENGKYTDINNLWIMVELCFDGLMRSKFRMCRSEYSVLHFANHYMHSHVNTIDYRNLAEFRIPCLGEGPIIETIKTLEHTYSLDLWALFCVELAKYVSVESLAGIPYKYLERLHYSNIILNDQYRAVIEKPTYSNIFPDKGYKLFISHLLKTKKLKFSYLNGSYTIGLPFIQCLITISNEFIHWYNDMFNKGYFTTNADRLLNSKFLNKCIIEDDKIYEETYSHTLSDMKRYIGTPLFTFKGQVVKLSIPDIGSIEDINTCILLRPEVVNYIINVILKVLNYRYETNKEQQQATSSGDSQSGEHKQDSSKEFIKYL